MEDQRLGALRTFSASPEGVRATVGEQVGRWQSTSRDQVVEGECLNDPKKEVVIGPHPRIGMGLPMSNIFATCVISV
jgi:pyruvate dehydrogenase kinase 2/3/4